MANNVNTDIYDKVVDRAAMLRRYEKATNGKVSLIIDGHEVKVNELIHGAKLTSKGKKRLSKAIKKQLNETFTEIYHTTKRSLIDLFMDQTSYAYQNIESVLSEVWHVKRPPRKVAEDFVLNKPLHADKTLSQGWNGVSVGERKRLEAVIRRGIAEGETPATIAKNVRKHNVHKITRNQARALTTTAITSVHTQADHSVYSANENALRGWQYVAVLDSRTTPVCAFRDGKIYPMSDTEHLPPAHFNCRSTTTPVVKAWDDLAKLENVAQVRKRNLNKLSPGMVQYYDGLTPMKESYNQWLMRQPKHVQYKHLGDYDKVELFRNGEIELDKFTNDGKPVGIRGLRRLSAHIPPNDTKRFAIAKEKLDAMHLGALSPDDFIDNKKLAKTLRDYYVLQSKELDGNLALTNYRGMLLPSKKAVRRRVLSAPPTEKQLRYNPLTKRYDDVRLYQPDPSTLARSYKLVEESSDLLDRDKMFIKKFVDGLSERMSMNERSVILDNLRITFGRQRKSGEFWKNFKAVTQAQMKYDVTNISEAMETNMRAGQDLLKKLLNSNYIDPVLGDIQLQDIHDNFLKNIQLRNKWEDKTAPKIARELKGHFNTDIPSIIRNRMSDADLQQFYLKFANRLSLADSPDIDQLAVALGRDLYTLANLNGHRKKWHDVGMKLLKSGRVNKFYDLETFGVQKRRLKSRLSGNYFGPYYDTVSYNLKIKDPRIAEYSKLVRKVELGLRVAVTEDKNRLLFREGYKTYFLKGKTGYVDTRIPITSTKSFGDFPETFVDKDLVDALNWASQAKYRIDEDYYDFINNLMYFKDDRGKAKFYDELNELKKYIASRGDAYERFKSMEWLRKENKAFSNNPFIDHRARVYDRGLISPQSGETFRPFLNTAHERNFSKPDFDNFQDQIGAFLGGLSEKFEGRYNSLSMTGRQKIAKKWRPEIVKLGNHMLDGKPRDMRAILESDMVATIDGEDLTKFFRFCMESAKIDRFLGGKYTKDALSTLEKYKTALALEQDASSSGAQIIALTTRNKQLAELSNVVATNQKRRLYDEIAAATFNDPDFQRINAKLGLSEIDLRKAAKAQNMVTFYGAGERTGIFNVEGQLAKILSKSKKTVPQALIDERQDVAGLLRLLGVENQTDPLHTGTLTEILDTQKALTEMITTGKIDKKRIADLTSWLHTLDVDLTKKRYERATYKTFDHNTGKAFSKEKVESNRLKFQKRSKGDKDRYITLQVVEELGELLEEHLKVSKLKNDKAIGNMIEAQKRALKMERFGADTVIKDEGSEYFKMTNLEAAKVSAKRAGVDGNVDDIIINLNKKLKKSIDDAGIDEIEDELNAILNQGNGTLVVTASDRDKVLDEISARAARYEKFDTETYNELKALRQDVRDVFNKGSHPGDDLLEQLYFLDNDTRTIVEKMTQNYNRIVTPDDFKNIAKIMSKHLSEQVPILKDFTKYFGRLAEDYLKHAKPGEANFDWKSIAKIELRGGEKKGYVLPDRMSEALGLRKGEPVSEKLLKRFGFWKPDGTLHDIIYGVKAPGDRKTGAKYMKTAYTKAGKLTLKNLKQGKILTKQKVTEFEVFHANELPKSWTNIPWVNFDGKTIEQNFTQVFEEKLVYKDKFGNWVTNIVQVPQKTEVSWEDILMNKSGKINDIADVNKARTAFAVNGNHSNDAVLVKRFHLWGKENDIPTSTIHDAFFANAADMLTARKALREIYAKMLDRNVIIETLKEMKARGLPKEVYDKYLKEAVDIGLIPVPGRSKVGDRLMDKKDILNKDDILKEIPENFDTDYGWYGVG